MQTDFDDTVYFLYTPKSRIKTAFRLSEKYFYQMSLYSKLEHSVSHFSFEQWHSLPTVMSESVQYWLRS